MRVSLSLALPLLFGVLSPGSLSPQLPGGTRTLVPPALLAPADSLNDQSRYQAAIVAVCGSTSSATRNELFGTEQRLARAAGLPNATAADWHRLACIRALLDVDNALGREGLQMPLGAGWQEGATNAWLQALRLDPGYETAADGLAVLALDQAFPRKGAAVRAALATAVATGAASPPAVRGCALLAVRDGDPVTARRCIELGLADGVDSTWQLLLRSRLDAAAHDTVAMMRSFDLALRSAADDAAWAEVGWHLRWFVEPEEWQQWTELAASERARWVRDRLTTRDVRDARNLGSRLAAHFERLDYVEEHFRRDIPRNQRGRLAVAAVPEDGSRGADPDRVRFTHQPEAVAAAPFRLYRPWSPLLDDRGSVYLRYGEPTRLVRWRSTIQNNFNLREGWYYQLDGRALVLQFEGEQFDGSPDATRLVAGVLGQYLCAFDGVRCAMVQRLACFELQRCSTDTTYSPITVEEIDALERDDEAMIAVATSSDHNAPRTAASITTVARLHRVWDAASGAVLAVVPYAFRVGDVARDSDTSGVTATLHLTFRQWDEEAALWLATDYTRRLRFAGRPDDNAYLTGYSVIPSSVGVDAWSLYAAQDSSRGGRAWAEGLRALSQAAPAMSDLIVGAESQGQVWTTTGGTAVPLGPLGAFDRQQPVSLYWQVQNGRTESSSRVTIALFKGGAGDNERPVLEVAFDASISPGLNEIQRTLGVEDLEPGRYRIEVGVRIGAANLSRSAPLLLH